MVSADTRHRDLDRDAATRRWRCADHGGCHHRGSRVGGSRHGVARGRRFDDGDHGAFGQLLAELNAHFPDHAGHRRWHIHRRLVGFEGHQRIVELDDVAGMTQMSITGTSV
jgi:hypothetical protein